MTKPKIKYIKASQKSYGARRAASAIKWIVIHYTGNKNDSALANATYFKNGNKRAAGAHFFVDESPVVYKSVPLMRVAWAVGGDQRSGKEGEARFHKKCTNANSISIEMCNSAKGVPSEVLANTVALTAWLMKKYNIKANHVIRHWDVNGKACPAPWASKDNKDWKYFKKELAEALDK